MNRPPEMGIPGSRDCVPKGKGLLVRGKPSARGVGVADPSIPVPPKAEWQSNAFLGRFGFRGREDQKVGEILVPSPVELGGRGLQDVQGDDQ